MFSPMIVRRTQIEVDENGIRALLKSVFMGYFHANAILNAVQKSGAINVHSFVVIAENQIIGICMVELSL